MAEKVNVMELVQELSAGLEKLDLMEHSISTVTTVATFEDREELTSEEFRTPVQYIETKAQEVVTAATAILEALE